ncbi:MAG: hypothetical protein B7Y62_03725 [Sphingomonadales bacterium 35-56-22]|jgi:hypothetical protein|nr:MAG: hypothetical protein B7Y62_03725 [Sphingomonadales bacterium 35-56-22]OYY98602.1 MAG: hypothetical protein B7Y38_01715 [Sphingomonadales bacterium 28-56-43]OYZ61775.1 MAG: hypothetical protein B7Y10_00545 [Sphingomonadales bacterium 24-56-14]OZA83992.1 MAG: hypothetical protein B7X66_02470 [Sphingomonadales bacterium 39-57-19]
MSHFFTNSGNPAIIQIGTLPAIGLSSRNITGMQKGRHKMRKDIGTSNDVSGSESRIWLAVALSVSMIFTSYAVSVLNHYDDINMNVPNYTHRPIVVSYLA